MEPALDLQFSQMAHLTYEATLASVISPSNLFSKYLIAPGLMYPRKRRQRLSVRRCSCVFLAR